MEETEFLQELLECSICLEQLTCQNKVLPCQHTFCLKCIKEIMQTQKELRCPECRLDCSSIKSLDELPHNILLIRLLEGLKQNMKIKNNRMGKTPNQTPIKHEFGKLSVLQHTPSQRQQLMSNETTFIKPPPLPLMHAQQYVSPRQLTNNGHSIIYGNAPAATQYPQNDRRLQLNLENTLLKQSFLTDNGTLSTINSQHQTTSKTPTNSITPNVPSMSSISPNNNIASSAINNQYQLIKKPIMCNARALQDSDMIGYWSIKKNDILFIKEQLNAYWYLAILFNGIQGVVPVSFVELIPNSFINGTNKNTTNCKTISPNLYSTLPSSMNSVMYQSMNNCNNVNNSVQNMNVNSSKPSPQSTPSTSQVQPISCQLPLAQQYFTQFTICRALYDFRVTDVNDKSCLSFKKNDLITLIRRVDQNWLEGTLDNNVGIFPITFVEFLPTIRPKSVRSSFLQNSNIISQPASMQTNGLPVHHTRTHSSNNMRQQSGTLLIQNKNAMNSAHSRSNSISIINDNNTSASAKNSALLCDNTNSNGDRKNTDSLITNPKLTLQSTNQFDNDLDPLRLTGSSGSNSYDNLLENKPSNQQNPNLYIALYNYMPQKKDELELKKNELYIVHEQCLDGWYKGSAVKDGSTGVFPGNYLILAKNKNVNGQQSYQNENRRSFGNLSSSAKFDSADNLLGEISNKFNYNGNSSNDSNLTKPKQLTSSFDNNLSDLNNTMTKMNLNNINAKSENYLTGQQRNNNNCIQQQHPKQNKISKSVEQLNNDDNCKTYGNLVGTSKNSKKNNDQFKKNDNNSSDNSPQWIQPKVAATRSASKQIKQNSLEPPYSLVLNNGDLSNELRIEVQVTTNSNEKTHVIKEIINTPIKKEEKKVKLIKMFTVNSRTMLFEGNQTSNESNTNITINTAVTTNNTDDDFYRADHKGLILFFGLSFLFAFLTFILWICYKGKVKSKELIGKNKSIKKVGSNQLLKVLTSREDRDDKTKKLRFSKLCAEFELNGAILKEELQKDNSKPTSVDPVLLFVKSVSQLKDQKKTDELDKTAYKVDADKKINEDDKQKLIKENVSDQIKKERDLLPSPSPELESESFKIGDNSLLISSTTNISEPSISDKDLKRRKSSLESIPSKLDELSNDLILNRIEEVRKSTTNSADKNELKDKEKDIITVKTGVERTKSLTDITNANENKTKDQTNEIIKTKIGVEKTKSLTDITDRDENKVKIKDEIKSSLKGVAEDDFKYEIKAEPIETDKTDDNLKINVKENVVDDKKDQIKKELKQDSKEKIKEEVNKRPKETNEIDPSLDLNQVHSSIIDTKPLNPSAKESDSSISSSSNVSLGKTIPKKYFNFKDTTKKNPKDYEEEN